MVDIISRSAWHAKYNPGQGPAPLPAKEVWLHHSVTSMPPDHSLAEIQAMQHLEQIGQQRFQAGISYTWLIMPSGRIYEGHGVTTEGTHTANKNRIARAVCFVGDYHNNHPTQAQLSSTVELLKYAHSQRWVEQPKLNGGHRDLKATDCPGRHAYAEIPNINAFLEFDMPDSEMVQDLSWRVLNFLRQDVTQTNGPSVNTNLPMVRDLLVMIWRVEAMMYCREKVYGGPTAGELVPLTAKLNDIISTLDNLVQNGINLTAEGSIIIRPN